MEAFRGVERGWFGDGWVGEREGIGTGMGMGWREGWMNNRMGTV